jgi:hypothetical protein
MKKHIILNLNFIHWFPTLLFYGTINFQHLIQIPSNTKKQKPFACDSIIWNWNKTKLQ